MKNNKDDRDMFFDSQAYFQTPSMPYQQGMPFMYYNPGMMSYYGNQNCNNNDNNLEQRVDKLERVVRRLEQLIQRIENKIDMNSNTYQTTNNNYSNSDTYMV